MVSAHDVRQVAGVTWLALREVLRAKREEQERMPTSHGAGGRLPRSPPQNFAKLWGSCLQEAQWSDVWMSGFLSSTCYNVPCLLSCLIRFFHVLSSFSLSGRSWPLILERPLPSTRWLGNTRRSFCTQNDTLGLPRASSGFARYAI